MSRVKRMPCSINGHKVKDLFQMTLNAPWPRKWRRTKKALPITSKAVTVVRMASIAGLMCLAYLYGMHKDASFIGFTCRSILMTVSELKKHYGLQNAI